MIRRACFALALGLVTANAGCVVTIDYDPVGTDASVQGTWLVNGATPNAASCSAIGATNVRVRFYDGSRTVDHPSLVFRCADGSFDTRPNPVLADGAWRMQLLAIDASGTVVAPGPIATYDTVVFGGHIVLDTVDFVPSGGASVTASWTIDGATANATNCANAGIAQVGLEFLDGTGAPIEDATVVLTCAAGSVLTEVAPGEHSVRMLALDASSTVLSMGTSEIFTVAAGATFTLNGGDPVDFITIGFNPRGTASALTSIWEIGGVAGDPDVCEAVEGTRVDILFADAADVDFSDEVIVQTGAPCDAGAFDSVSPILAAGTYLVAVELKDALGAVISRVESLTPITVVAGTPALVDIDFRLAHATVHVFLSFEGEVNGGVFFDCAGAGVDTIEWELYFADDVDPIAESGGPMTCEDFVNVMGSTADELAPGTYELVLLGANAGGKTWDTATGASACTVTIDAAGGLGTRTCGIDRPT